MRLPLNSKNVLIPRQFIECGGCQHNVAVIRLAISEVTQMGIQKAIELKSNIDIKLEEGTVGSLPLKQNNTTKLLEGNLSGIWKKKMCITLKEHTEELSLKGFPVIVEDKLTQRSVLVGIVNENFSSKLTFSSVRLDIKFYDFVNAWLSLDWENKMISKTSSKILSRFDCFPPYPTANFDESICLCSIGWTNERFDFNF